MNIRALIGVGLDGDDGHTRITRSEEFCLYGGSRETHEQMTEVATRFTEKVHQRGKPLPQISRQELRDITSELREEL